MTGAEALVTLYSCLLFRMERWFIPIPLSSIKIRCKSSVRPVRPTIVSGMTPYIEGVSLLQYTLNSPYK